MTQLDDMDFIAVRIQHERRDPNSQLQCFAGSCNSPNQRLYSRWFDKKSRAELPVVLSIAVIQSSFRRLLRTSNGVERMHREVRRRASVVSIFPNPAACLRLVSAILAEISEEWLTGRTYLNFEGATYIVLVNATCFSTFS
jgi:transposase-like protein